MCLAVYAAMTEEFRIVRGCPSGRPEEDAAQPSSANVVSALALQPQPDVHDGRPLPDGSKPAAAFAVRLRYSPAPAAKIANTFAKLLNCSTSKELHMRADDVSMLSTLTISPS